MTIPNEPLEVTIDPDDLTLADLELFEPEGFTVKGFIRFLDEHTNWEADEIRKITVGEMKDINEQLREAFAKAAVPLAS